MIHGRCSLCLIDSQLCESHIIPNALFRRIKKRQKTGNLIKFNDHPCSKVVRSQESWWEHLLCQKCEGKIRDFETYGLKLIRGGASIQFAKHDEGITFRNHSYKLFKLFLTSIVWRAAVSKQETFHSVHAPVEAIEAARQSLLNGEAQSPAKFGVRLARLVDNSGAEGAFSPETLKTLIVSPIAREPSNIGYSVLFLLEGFLLEYFIPFMPNRLRDEHGTHRDSPTLFVPYRCIFIVPELANLLVTAYGKQQRGIIAFDG